MDTQQQLMKRLNSTAFNLLSHDLTFYGNIPSEAQNKALRKLIETYTALAFGEIQGRYAFPLATGAGKTCSIIAWLTALAVCKINLSVAVSASKVEALCSIKRDLEEHLERHRGSLSVGLWHSYKYDPDWELKDELSPGKASMPSDQLETLADKQILLLTHNRVRHENNVDKFNTYQEKPRNVLIYDESLLISNTRSIPSEDLKASLGFAKATAKQGTVKGEAVSYIQDALKLFDRDLENQKENSKEPKQIILPGLSLDKLDSYRNSFKKSFPTGVLRDFLEFSQEPLRVVDVNQAGGGVVTYDLVVPPDLKNIVILDASHNIRDLVRLSRGIETVPECDRFKVSYKSVTVKHLKYGSGRGAMTDLFRAGKLADRKVSQELAHTIQHDIPSNEGVLIFTFKANGQKVYFKEILQDDLKSLGVNLNATVNVRIKNAYKPIEKPRFNFLTWGNETSHNEFSYCKHVILAGVLYRAQVELASAIVGQMDNLTAQIPGSLINQIEQTECAHCIYQASSRGHSRILKSGRAGTMTLYLIHAKNEIKELLAPVMEGVNWIDWNGKFLVNQTKLEKTSEVVEGYLERLPSRILRVSSRRIKKECDLSDMASRTYARVIKMAAHNSDNWKQEGQSLLRTGFYEYFPEESDGL